MKPSTNFLYNPILCISSIPAGFRAFRLGNPIEIAAKHPQKGGPKLAVRQRVRERITAAVQVAHVVGQVVHHRGDALTAAESVDGRLEFALYNICIVQYCTHNIFGMSDSPQKR